MSAWSIFEVVQDRGARPVVHELAALVEEGGVVLVGFDDEGACRLAQAAPTRRSSAARRRPGSPASGRPLRASRPASTWWWSCRACRPPPAHGGRAARARPATAGRWCRRAPASRMASISALPRVTTLPTTKTVRLEGHLLGAVAFDQLDAERAQLLAHRRVDVGVAAGDAVAGFARQRRQPAHEGAADAEDVDVHVRAILGAAACRAIRGHGENALHVRVDRLAPLRLPGARGAAHRRHRAAAGQPGAVRAARLGLRRRSCRCRRWRGWRCALSLAGFARHRRQRAADVRRPAGRTAGQPRLRREDGPGDAGRVERGLRSTCAAAWSCSTARRGCRPWSRWGFGLLSSSAAAGLPMNEESTMQRRTLIAAALAAPLAARAHHGWSSFDQGRPIWLEGRATKVAWRNPHAEIDARAAGRPEAAGRPGQAQAAGAVGRRRRRGAAEGGAAADAQGPRLGDRTGAADAHGGLEGARDQDRRHASACSASPSPARRAMRCCAPSTCSSAARSTACARARPERRSPAPAPRQSMT